MSSETEFVTLIDLLDRLIPPDPPPPIPMVPQTGGWLVLGAGLAALAVWALWRWHRHWRSNAYRRAALAALADTGDDPTAIAAILRRTALAAYPRATVAGLSGDAWLGFLDRTGGCDDFRTGPGRALADAPYHPVAPSPDLTRLAAHWVRRHVRAAGAVE